MTPSSFSMKMRLAPSFASIAFLCGLAGCTEEMAPPRYAVLAPAEKHASANANVTTVVAPPSAPLQENAELQGASRPRLSRTLRLGEETATYDTGLRAAPPPSTSPNVTVVVNNNITQQQTMVGGGGGYGGGYGLRRDGYGTYARPTYGTSPSISAPQQPQAPRSSPPVGGNWAPPANYGPPAMR